MIFKKLILKCKFIFFLTLMVIAQNSKALSYDSIKEIKFVPKHLNAQNEIKFLNETLDLESIRQIQTTCHPLKKNNVGVYKKDGSGEVYFSRSILVSQSKGLQNTGKKIEMVVNGIYIESPKITKKRGVGLTFALAENCTKLIPVGFISSKDQNYLGFKISKGDMVSPKYWTLEGEIAPHYGYFSDNGYYKQLTKQEEGEKLKELKSLKTALKYKEPHDHMCIKVVSPSKVAEAKGNNESEDKEQGFYIYRGKKIDIAKGNPRLWLAKSKYVGHRLCSEQPEAVIDCVGMWGLDKYYLRRIFGLDPKDPDESQEAYQNKMKKAEEKGKKCDMAVAKYEKETGKKVKVSPFLPKEIKSKFTE